MKAVYLTGAAIISVAAALPAQAQDKAMQDGNEAADPSEIVVTATLRSENLQSVPVAVTAVSGEALEKAGVRDIKSFEQVAPSFNINSTSSESGGTTLRIRGIGTTGNNSGLESAVGIFMDGVYLSRPGVALGDLVDVDQIELLRGPQGTLFGRNTSAGAVTIKTRKPNLTEIEGFANATYGNYNLYNLQTGISVPLVADKLGVRLSGAWRQRDGFVRNVVGDTSNNRNRFIVRGQIYAEPSPDLSIRVIADYSQFDERCCDAIIIRDSSYAAVGLFAPSGLPANGGADYSGVTAFNSYQTSNNFESRDKMKQWGVSGTLNYTFGDAELTSITAYRWSRSNPQAESDFVSVNVYSTSNGGSTATANSGHNAVTLKTFTQELRLAGSAWDGKIDYLIGGYYADERIDDINSFTMGADHQAYISTVLRSLGVPGSNPARTIFASGVSSAGNFATNNYRQNGRNWSLFTNNTIHLTDSFGINFGLRYSDDRKDGSFKQLAASSPACSAVRANAGLLGPLNSLVPLATALTCFPFATQVNTGAGTPVEFARVFKDNELVYTGKLLWRPSQNINLYASYTHGYKAGGFNLDSTAAVGGADPRFNSEKVNSYELGIKAKLLDRRATVNIALFREDFKDFQVLEFTGTQYTTFNVPKVRAEGFEIEAALRPASNLTVNSSVTYSKARYPTDCAGSLTATQVRTLCGLDLTNAPRWTVVSGFDWTHSLGNALEFGLNGSIRLESDRRTSTQGYLLVAAGTGTTSLIGGTNNAIRAPFDVQDGNAKVNLRASIGSQAGRWALEFWGVNVFNVRTYSTAFNLPLRGSSALPGPLNAGGISVARGVLVQEPRTYGVTARVKF